MSFTTSTPCFLITPDIASEFKTDKSFVRDYIHARVVYRTWHCWTISGPPRAFRPDVKCPMAACHAVFTDLPSILNHLEAECKAVESWVDVICAAAPRPGCRNGTSPQKSARFGTDHQPGRVQQPIDFNAIPQQQSPCRGCPWCWTRSRFEGAKPFSLKRLSLKLKGCQKTPETRKLSISTSSVSGYQDIGPSKPIIQPSSPASELSGSTSPPPKYELRDDLERYELFNNQRYELDDEHTRSELPSSSEIPHPHHPCTNAPNLWEEYHSECPYLNSPAPLAYQGITHQHADSGDLRVPVSTGGDTDSINVSRRVQRTPSKLRTDVSAITCGTGSSDGGSLTSPNSTAITTPSTALSKSSATTTTLPNLDLTFTDPFNSSPVDYRTNGKLLSYDQPVTMDCWPASDPASSAAIDTTGGLFDVSNLGLVFESDQDFTVMDSTHITAEHESRPEAVHKVAMVVAPSFSPTSKGYDARLESLKVTFSKLRQTTFGEINSHGCILAKSLSTHSDGEVLLRALDALENALQSRQSFNTEVTFCFAYLAWAMSTEIQDRMPGFHGSLCQDMEDFIRADGQNELSWRFLSASEAYLDILDPPKAMDLSDQNRYYVNDHQEDSRERQRRHLATFHTMRWYMHAYPLPWRPPTLPSSRYHSWDSTASTTVDTNAEQHPYHNDHQHHQPLDLEYTPHNPMTPLPPNPTPSTQNPPITTHHHHQPPTTTTLRRRLKRSRDISCTICGFEPDPGPDRQKKLARHRLTRSHQQKKALLAFTPYPGQEDGLPGERAPPERMEMREETEIRFHCTFLLVDGSVCTKTFNRKDNLQQHCRRKHAGGSAGRTGFA